MKKFVLLHYGFEEPTPEIMAAWGKWFEQMKDNIVDMAGPFGGGREISKAGTTGTCRWAVNRSPASPWCTPKASMRRRKWRKAIPTYRASGSMKRCRGK